MIWMLKWVPIVTGARRLVDVDGTRLIFWLRLIYVNMGLVYNPRHFNPYSYSQYNILPLHTH